MPPGSGRTHRSGRLEQRRCRQSRGLGREGRRHGCAVMQNISRFVIYNNGLDITDIILKQLNAGIPAPPAAATPPAGVLYLVLQTLDQRIYFLICIVTITSTIGLISRV